MAPRTAVTRSAVTQAVDGRAELARRAAQLGVVRASELVGGRGRRDGDRRGWGAPDAPARTGGAGRRNGVGAPAPVPPGPRAPASTPDAATGPPPSAGEESAVLPVSEPLAGLLPWGGLRRGSTVAVGGSAALVLAVLAEASRAGSWCALVGLPGIGAQAAAEAGVDLARTALVPRPGPRAASVVAALVDGVDVVVLGGAASWRAGDRQRLAARVRQRGAVLVPVIAGPDGWPGAEVELHAAGGTWSGLAGDGAGRLRTRRVRLRCSARGRAHDRRTEALLPGPGGRCAPAAEPDERPSERPERAPGPAPATGRAVVAV